MQCLVSKGDLPLKIHWELNDRDVNDIQGIATGQMNKRISTLSIENVQAEHAGKYTCIATNLAGRGEHSTYLNVNGTFFQII